MVRAELLKAGAAVRAGAIRIDQTADADKVARFELVDRRTHLGDPPDDLVAGHAWIDGGHHVVPLVASIVKVPCADHVIALRRRDCAPSIYHIYRIYGVFQLTYILIDELRLFMRILARHHLTTFTVPSSQQDIAARRSA